MEGRRKIICWDCDETIGYFDMLQYQFKGGRSLPSASPISLRFGVKSMLARLSDAGYTHCITSRGTHHYLSAVMRRGALTPYFWKVFSRDLVAGIEGKLYRLVALNCDVMDHEIPDRMIVIGNLDTDRPIDVNNLVFINHSNGYLYDSHVTEQILHALNEAENTSFYQGFCKLFGERTPAPKAIHLPGDITFQMQFRERIFNGRRVSTPEIFSIEAEKHRRQPVTVT